MAQSLSTLSSLVGSDDWRQRARTALSWLREKYVRLRNYKITPDNILREGTRANFPLAGRMYFYSYDPKPADFQRYFGKTLTYFRRFHKTEPHLQRYMSSPLIKTASAS